MQPSKEQTQTPMTKAGFMFGPWSCKWSEVFFLGKHSLAMVNLKPIVPGKSPSSLNNYLYVDRKMPTNHWRTILHCFHAWIRSLFGHSQTCHSSLWRSVCWRGLWFMEYGETGWDSFADILQRRGPDFRHSGWSCRWPDSAPCTYTRTTSRARWLRAEWSSVWWTGEGWCWKGICSRWWRA